MGAMEAQKERENLSQMDECRNKEVGDGKEESVEAVEEIGERG